MNREQIVRDKAYGIWEAEGRPDGRDAEHWQRAEKQVAADEAAGSRTSAASETKPATRQASGKAASKPAANKTAAGKAGPAKTAASKEVAASMDSGGGTAPARGSMRRTPS